MHVHTVVVDEEKCRKYGKDPQKVWNAIETIYASYDMKREGNTFIADFDFDYTKEMCAIINLAKRQWFFELVDVWNCDSDFGGINNLYRKYNNMRLWESRFGL